MLKSKLKAFVRVFNCLTQKFHVQESVSILGRASGGFLVDSLMLYILRDMRQISGLSTVRESRDNIQRIKDVVPRRLPGSISSKLVLYGPV